jgi:Tfp pilus assembly protein PilO
MEILKKIPWFLILVMWIVFLAYDYYDFEQGSDSQKQQKKTQVKAKETERETLQVEIKKAKDFYDSLETNRKELRKLAQELSDMKTTLSDNIDVSEFLSLVDQEAKKVGLIVKSLKPGEKRTKDYYVEQSFDLNFQGVYAQFLVFLDRLSQTSRIVRVDNFAVKPIGSQRAKYVDLQGQVELKTYYYLGTKEDELGVEKKTATAPGGGG